MTTKCKVCGSTKAKLLLDRCVNEAGCNVRRIERRIREDDKRGGRQCMNALGSSSIRFCVMHEGHKGLHTNGGIEWGSEEESPVGRMFASVLRLAPRSA